MQIDIYLLYQLIIHCEITLLIPLKHFFLFVDLYVPPSHLYLKLLVNLPQELHQATFLVARYFDKCMLDHLCEFRFCSIAEHDIFNVSSYRN